MPTRRLAASAFLALIAAACVTLPKAQPANTSSEITLVLAAPPQRVHEEVLAAFSSSGLPVAVSQPGVIEFHGARERAMIGYSEVFARAVIEPVDCTTRVRLFGEETQYANATTPQGTAVRIGPSSSGRAADVWRRLQTVAQTLGRDPTLVRAHC